ncbi:hypothetical protein FOT98_18375 [Bacillus sp. HY001]|uniref:hypothetical protein n=1 Tax=Bacillus TaxID=1386 RepID=UPI001184CC15|nr:MULTISPECIES: hypothetical protein [Bacillus]TSI12489.1 hypothetical protein FOT98_18375 [Bacillus sp. HY001]
MENNTTQKNTVIEGQHDAVAVVEETTALDFVKADSVSPSIFEAEGNKQLFFSSIQAKDRKSAVKVYNAINMAENPLADHKGEVLSITDMVAHAITLQDDITKEDVNALRVVLIAEDGKAYHAISEGIVGSMQRIISIVGQAPWTPALKVVPVEVKTRKGFKTLTLQLAE